MLQILSNHFPDAFFSDRFKTKTLAKHSGRLALLAQTAFDVVNVGGRQAASLQVTLITKQSHSKYGNLIQILQHFLHFISDNISGSSKLQRVSAYNGPDRHIPCTSLYCMQISANHDR